MHRRIIYIILLLFIAFNVNAQKQKHKSKNKQNSDVIENIEEYKGQCKNLVGFLQGTLNFLGDSSQVMSEKEIIINQSYLKIFRDSKVQIEDDLDPGRNVPLRKDVQAYLKDIVFFYKNVSINFEIKNIEVLGGENNEITFKVTTNRSLKGIMVNNDTIDNNLTRYIEINYDPFEQDMKIVSIYTTLPNQKEEIRYWWKTLPDSWRMLFGKNVLVYDTLPMSRIASFEDSLIVIITKRDTIIKDTLVMNDTLTGYYDTLNRYGHTIDSSLFDTVALRNVVYTYDTIAANTDYLDFYLKSIFNLKRLDVSNNKTIKTLKPVSRLTKLEKLSCSNTDVDDLVPVRNLSKLTVLDVSNTGINSIEPLKFCFALEELNLANTEVENIDVLAGLKDLEKLVLDGTEVKDITPLSNLENLTFLSLANTGITDLSPVSGLKSLKRLILKSSKVTDLSPLSTLESLEYINIDSTQVSDLSPLSSIQTLKTIQANNSAISDFDGLGSNENLKLIYCDNTKIDREKALSFMELNPDVLVIFDSEKLKSWWINLPDIWKSILSKGCGFEEVTEKEQLHKIVNTKKLSLSGIDEIKSLKPIKMLFRLEELDMSNTNLTDITPLASLNNLRYLNMDNTPVTSVDALKNLTSLRIVKMDNTEVADILPLKNNKYLDRVYCDNTNVVKKNVLEFKKYVPDCLIIYQTEILKFWWNNLPDEWRPEFNKILGTEEYPSKEQLQDLVDTKSIKVKNNVSITSLEPIAIFDFLRELTVNFTKISDLTPLSELDSLVVLNLSNNPIVDISPLSDLYNLEKLFLENTGVEDLSPISKLKKLKVLSIAGTKVRKLKPISGLVNLEKLIMNNTGINKLKYLDNLKKLSLITCYNTRIKKKTVDSFKETHPDIEIVYY